MIFPFQIGVKFIYIFEAGRVSGLVNNYFVALPAISYEKFGFLRSGKIVNRYVRTYFMTIGNI